jgi:hypothetical protein
MTAPILYSTIFVDRAEIDVAALDFTLKLLGAE